MDARFSYKGEDVVATLDRVCLQTGYPKTIWVENGSKVVSCDMDPWAYHLSVTVDVSRPEPPGQRLHRSLYGQFRAECLNAHWFMGLEDTAEKLEA